MSIERHLLQAFNFSPAVNIAAFVVQLVLGVAIAMLIAQTIIHVRSFRPTFSVSDKFLMSSLICSSYFCIISGVGGLAGFNRPWCQFVLVTSTLSLPCAKLLMYAMFVFRLQETWQGTAYHVSNLKRNVFLLACFGTTTVCIVIYNIFTTHLYESYKPLTGLGTGSCVFLPDTVPLPATFVLTMIPLVEFVASSVVLSMFIHRARKLLASTINTGVEKNSSVKKIDQRVVHTMKKLLILCSVAWASTVILFALWLSRVAFSIFQLDVFINAATMVLAFRWNEPVYSRLCFSCIVCCACCFDEDDAAIGAPSATRMIRIATEIGSHSPRGGNSPKPSSFEPTRTVSTT